MAFRKKTSSIVDAARKRLSGLKTIEVGLDFGNGLSNMGMEGKIAELDAKLELYNSKLSEADEARNVFEEKEKEVQDFYKRMLSGVGTRYGYDSNQYEMAGGTRESDRKKPVSKKKTE
ncbi:MAG: hypothetical protein V4714_04950 [Bacteroidota bacterium]